uniref:Glutamine amidotransferase domain-containing protein n=1 Tax=candidate division WOR-3 bacterium TaxID=2052148 RepID=A0A7C4U7J1_UNCW3
MIQLINAYKDKDKIKNLYEFLNRFSDVHLSDDFNIKKGVHSIVISGSERFVSEGEFEDKWIKFIQEIEIPLLGICYGMQLISYSFGANLIKGERIKGLRKVWIINREDILKGLPETPYLPERHYERVVSVSLNQDIIGISDDGIEGIKIKERKIFGTQFHFERSKKYGSIIIKNFLNIAK